MKKDTFANRLQQAIFAKGLKQIDIVNKTKIDKTLLNKYIKGISEPKQDNLSLLAEVLEVNEVWLMGYDVPFDSVETPLDLFLSSMEYENIENFIKNDVRHVSIGYVNTSDIIFRIYIENSMDKFNCETHEFQSEIINKNEKDRNSSISFMKELRDGNLLEAKKSRFFLSIRKFYDKQDIIKELENRNTFSIVYQRNHKEITDTETRYKILTRYLDIMTDENFDWNTEFLFKNDEVLKKYFVFINDN